MAQPPFWFLYWGSKSQGGGVDLQLLMLSSLFLPLDWWLGDLVSGRSAPMRAETQAWA